VFVDRDLRVLPMDGFNLITKKRTTAPRRIPPVNNTTLTHFASTKVRNSLE
jgi:hypothetical protein